jgi:GNAT superfamily N-acetyltransferase
VEDAETLLNRCAQQQGAAQEVLLLALQLPEANESDVLVGTIHVQRTDNADDAEIGMFSVDPDRQGGGAGGALLSAAHEVARAQMQAKRTVMWVISDRTELLAWYVRKGYCATGETVPFPDTDDRVGVPKKKLTFLRMERPC